MLTRWPEPVWARKLMPDGPFQRTLHSIALSVNKLCAYCNGRRRRPWKPVFSRPAAQSGLDAEGLGRLYLSAFRSLRKVNKKAESAEAMAEPPFERVLLFRKST